MNLTKKEREEITHVYDTWLNSYLTGDVKTYDAYFDDAYHFIGSTDNEDFLDRRSTTKFLEDTADQMSGKVQIKNNRRILEKFGGLIFVTELLDAYFLIEGEWTYYGKFRFTSALQKNKEGWRFIYQHFSTPDSKAQKGETIGTEKIAAENLMLREAVQRRTVELEQRKHELEVEAALERARNQSLLMQHSDEIKDLSKIFHEQLVALNIPSEFSYIWLPDERKGEHMFWATWSESKSGKPVTRSKSVIYPLDKSEPYTAACFEAWESDIPVHMTNIPPEEITKFFATWKDLIKGARRLKAHNFPEGIYYAESYMRYGCFGINIRRPLNEEEKDVLFRFTVEFERAYTRFLDLQKSEAQAREAQVELALERVRSKVTAMQESSELLDIVVTMRSEFVTLGHNADYFWYMRYLPGIYEKAMTSGDGTRIGMVMTLPRHIHGDIKLVADWEESGEPVLVFPMEVETAVEYVHKMITLGDFKQVDPNAPTLDDIRHIGGLTFVMARTTHGEIGYSLAGVVSDPPEEDLTTLVRFASVFDLAYRRFEDLKIAEANALKAQQDLIEIKEARKNAEKALSELKATQSQLIHAEKMASLGELTAGIAHEIQNPLNFVNNFSEVSAEMVDEMKQELAVGSWQSAAGSKQSAMELLDDIRKNLDKILHHGKRADAIVKGMLQHSRTSTGKKEPTDINALADEYLRLAYHGLRAKDKSFNANFRLEADESLPKINVIPQDIGRVLLNLINNAFYAVFAEASAKADSSYKPTVIVKTNRQSTTDNRQSTIHPPPLRGDTEGPGVIEIRVKDNGSGIPDEIKDKIFQPFFTTKPTGEGTGLGLSLSYDIIKAHGGKLSVNSTEGQGSEFIIQLIGE